MYKDKTELSKLQDGEVIWERLPDDSVVVYSKNQKMPVSINFCWWANDRFAIQKDFKKFLLGLKIYQSRHAAHTAILTAARFFKNPENIKLIDRRGLFLVG